MTQDSLSYKEKFERLIAIAKSDGILREPFSQNAIEDFCMHINRPIRSVLDELVPLQKLYHVVGCEATGAGISEPIFVGTNFEKIELFENLKNIKPIATLDLNFILRDKRSGKINEMTRVLSVNFREDEYVVSFPSKEGADKESISKMYCTYLAPQEVDKIKENICESFYKTLAHHLISTDEAKTK